MERRKYRILLVDDHEDTLNMTAYALIKSGYEVATASTKGEATNLCKTGDFDVLLGDLSLPDGSGLDLMTEIAATCKIKGIAFTGHGSADDIAKTKAAGFSAHVTKPADMVMLLKTIERIIGEGIGDR